MSTSHKVKASRARRSSSTAEEASPVQAGRMKGCHHAAQRHAVRLTRTALVLLSALTLSFCAPRWTLRTARPTIDLQWPFQPNKAKLTYLRSVTGLSERKGSGSVLHTIVFGKERADRGGFVLPVAVATGGDGRLAVADLGERCVHLYLPADRRYMKVAGPANARIVSPVSVVFDDALRLWVSDSTGRVLVFDRSGQIVHILERADDGPLQRPTGLTFSPARGLVYVVDTLANEVHAFRTSGEPAFSFGGRGEAEGRFNFPTHIFRSAAAELFVTDALNFRIAVFDEDGKPRASFGRQGDGSGDLARPKGIAVDADGVVYVADGLFDNVQLFDRGGRFLLTLGTRGAEPGEFWLPSGLFISGDELYVCDTYNRRIQVFRISEHYGAASS